MSAKSNKQCRFFTIVLTLSLVIGALRYSAFAAINLDGVAIPAFRAFREALQETAEQIQNRISATPQTLDIIQFQNGDTLHGTLEGIENSIVIWKSPEARSNIEFFTTNLFEISFVKKENPTNIASGCAIKLVNGDEIPGDLKELTEGELILQTWYGGVLRIKRNTIRSLLFTRQTGGCIFDGPTGLDGWRIGRGRAGWRYSDGAFVASRPGQIGRDMKLPDRVKISYDLAWQGGIFFIMSIFADNPEELYSNCYVLQFNTGYINLQKLRRNAGSRNLGQVEILSLNEKNKARIEVYADREKGVVALFIDGAFVKQWKDSNESPLNGTCIHFQQQAVNLLKLTNLRVEEWDGRLDSRLGSETTQIENDLVELVNHDKLSGRLHYIKEEKLKFTTSFAEMEIPLDRVYSFELASKDSAKIERKKGEIVGTFVGRGNVCFTLEKWDKNAVVGSNPCFGKFSFLPQAFSRITFNFVSTDIEPEIQDSMDEGEQ
ncbi:MAG: hypothetical protein ACPMAG_03790 [Limisphaerales bacterium]